MKISSDRNFGVEIECKGLSREQASAALRNVGIPCRLEDYNHQVAPTWKVVPDSSVIGGFEVVSPILKGQEGLNQVQKVSDALVAAGAKVEKDCGFHVHVDARDLSGLTLANILTRYAKYETAIDAVMPESRREDNNQYCLSVKDIAVKIQEDLWHSISATVIANRIEGRYYKLNLTAFVRHGTVEFRQHSGTVEARKMIPWIIFCVNFVETSKVSLQEEELPEINPTAHLRKNAIEKKYIKLAKILDDAYNSSGYVPVDRIAEAMGVKETAVANHISAFRKKYQVRIVYRRGFGYRRYYGLNGLQAAMGITPPAKKIRVVIPDDTGMFTGLDQDIVSYFQERALDLAA